MINSERPQVILRFCDTYHTPTIRTIIREGLRQLKIHPSGRVLLKPNLVSSGRYSTMLIHVPSSLKGYYLRFVTKMTAG